MPAMTDEPPPSPDPWLLLIHQLPAKPAYFRVKIWRRLQGLGAVAVRNAVYALPANEQTQEDFEWLLKEIVEGGGEAMRRFRRTSSERNPRKFTVVPHCSV